MNENLLEADHQSLGKLIEELDVELASFNLSRAFNLLDLFWARLAVHIRAEHLQLFPALDAVQSSQLTGRDGLPTSAEVESILDGLRSDHDFFMKELALMIKAMRKSDRHEMSVEEIRSRLGVLGKRLNEHNRVEEEQVYVWPSLLLDPQTVADLHKRVQHELSNLPQRFA